MIDREDFGEPLPRKLSAIPMSEFPPGFVWSDEEERPVFVGEGVYRRFYEAWWEREKGTVDFDLHAETVERFRRAFEDVRRYRDDQGHTP